MQPSSATPNLDKEFWNNMHTSFPDAVECFYKWIEDYKKEIDWKSLFGDKNFSDIPFEMQNGIMARFELEFYNWTTVTKGKAEYQESAKRYRTQIISFFAILKKKLLYKKSRLN